MPEVIVNGATGEVQKLRKSIAKVLPNGGDVEYFLLESGGESADETPCFVKRKQTVFRAGSALSFASYHEAQESVEYTITLPSIKDGQGAVAIINNDQINVYPARRYEIQEGLVITRYL